MRLCSEEKIICFRDTCGPLTKAAGKEAISFSQDLKETTKILVFILADHFFAGLASLQTGALLEALSLFYLLTCACFAVIKHEETPPVKLESTEVKEPTYCKSPPFNNRVSTITTVIKSDIRNTEAPSNPASVVMAPSAPTRRDVNDVAEAERAVVKSIQQAKIPLKKRELKLAESYHSNHHPSTNTSSIIVCNPAAPQAKDAHGGEGGASDSQTCRQQPPAHREGQNGVAGLVGHVGVICSPSEHHRAPSARLEEQPPAGLEEKREVRRQTVLVRKEVAEKELVALTATEIDINLPRTHTLEIAEKQLDSADVSFLKISSEVAEDPSDIRKETEPSSQQKAHIQTLEEPKFASAIADTPVKPHQEDGAEKEEEEEEAAKAADAGGVKDGRLKSEGKRWPPDKAFSELQKEGIRLKIKIPPQRKNKFKDRGDKQERDGKQDVQEEGTPLRRSARICRCVCVAVENIQTRSFAALAAP